MNRAACFLSGAVAAASALGGANVTTAHTSQTLAPPALLAQVNRNSISGMVMGPDRRPLREMDVELLSEYNVQIGQRQRTNASGRYYFQNLLQGVYRVRVLTGPTDYEEQTQEVTIQNIVRQSPGGGAVVSGFESIQLDFTMRLRKPRAGTAAANSAPAGTVFSQPVPAEARRVYEQAVSDLNAGKKDEEGLAGLKRAIELYPIYYDALDRLGAEYVKQRKYDEALPVLTKAIEANSRSYTSLYSLGIAQFYTGQWRASAETFRRATNVRPDSVNAQISLGIALKRDGQLEQAEAAFKHAGELAKGTAAEAHWQLALLYHKQKRYAAAADELELFLKVMPDARDAEQIRKLIKQFREKAGVASSATP